ncbi:MAG: hypothetical protein MRJ93_12955 [Nitrososphaeraceae archaeon]|nr:hypothetical protein [Nitrososphaeraceae archaeon]
MSSKNTDRTPKKNKGSTSSDDLSRLKRRNNIKKFPKETIRDKDNPFTPEGLVQCLLNDSQLTRKAIALMLQELQNIESVLLAIKNRGYL